MTRPPRRQRGFTLIELMIAVGLLALIGALIFGFMTVSIRGRRQAYRLQERYHAARIAMSRMRKELESAYISNHRNIDKYPKTLFVGSKERIDFTYLGHLRVAEGARESDQGAVSYFLESDPDHPGQKALMRREKTPIDDRPRKGGVVQKLAENVKSLRFEFWDPKDFEWERDWKAELDPVDVTGGANPLSRIKKAEEVLSGDEDEFILPSRVRIQLVLKDDEGHEYPFETQARIYMREPLAW